MTLRTSTLAAAVVVMAACSKSGEGPTTPPVIEPQIPTTLSSNVATSLTGTVGTATSVTPAVTLRDAKSAAIAGTMVRFVVSGGGSIVNDSARTDANGVATSGTWTLGEVSGTQRVVASTSSLTPVAFTVQASAGAPTRLTLVGGNNGAGVANAALEVFAALPSVSVSDAFGNPVAGVSVAFIPGANSGSVVGSPAITNATGAATISSWVLGSVASQTLIATSASIPGAQVVFSATAQVNTFGISVRYIDVVPSARQQLAVTRAIAKWRSVILGNIGTSRVKLDAQNCGRNWSPGIDEMVTNLLILARIGPIDGVGGVVGDAGPCVLHSSSQLTSYGTMLFDSADLATLESSGLIDAVMAHEMGHVLGVGLLWTERSMVADLGTADPIFTGATATQQFQLLLSGYSGRLVPVENAGGAGSINAHWRESVMRTELMTSILSAGTNPLSRVTVGSLEDIGYDVSYTGAEAYTLTSSAVVTPFAETASPFGLEMQRDIHMTPLFTTDKLGRLSRWTPELR